MRIYCEPYREEKVVIEIYIKYKPFCSITHSNYTCLEI